MQQPGPSGTAAGSRPRLARFVDYLGLGPLPAGSALPPGPSIGARIGRDFAGGSISALVMLSMGLSFAAMIFAGSLAPALGYGIRMALTSASATVIVVALMSPFRFAIAGPDSRSAAVQSTLVAGLVAGVGSHHLPTPLILLALSFSTALTGILLYLCGRLQVGSWIRYVPYPVIGGFLASTGWTLLVGAVKVITNRPQSLAMLPSLLLMPTLLQLIVGILFTLLLLQVLSRTKHFLALPGLLVLGTLAFHLVRIARGLSVTEAQERGWLLKVAAGGHLWFPLYHRGWAHADWSLLSASTLAQYAGGLVVVVAVTAIALLITGAAIEVATRSDVNLDQELRSHGIANLLSGLCGGIIGQNAIARSMINLQAGGSSRLSGVFAGCICLVVELTRPELAGLLARPIMGATLAYLGIRLLEEWIWKARAQLERIDYLMVLGILLLIIWAGFVVGLLGGLALSCLIFAVNYSRISVIRSSFTVDEFGSKVQRAAAEQALVREQGDRHYTLRLRGYLFFGSVVRLLHEIRQRIDTSQQKGRPLQTLVLDWSAAIGIDSSAALTLVKLRQLAERSHLQLIFTGLQPEMRRLLRREHCLRDDELCLERADLDSALEYCEEKILNQAAEERSGERSFAAQLALALGGEAAAQRLLTYTERLELAPEAYLVRQGGPSDALFIIESGRVRILLELPNGPPLRLRTVAAHTCLGEIGLYRNLPRSTSVIAEVPTVIHRLSKSTLARMEQEEPQLAMAFHIFIIRTLAERLTSSDKTIAALTR